ncbi:MAG: NADH-quinone oxidoreductase subunit J [Woeseiaceae bacterium]|nr:NADH-quinone oxidoreductase subunit J [Woeseiaceae bacterium]
MLFHSILFYAFSLVLLGAACGVVFSKNPIHSIMFLVLTFFQAAILWLMAEAEFLAIVLVLVYVGAVMVLFLFVVMMLEVDIEAVKKGMSRYTAPALAIAALMTFELINLIWLRSSDEEVGGNFQPLPEGYDNTKALGEVLYTEHVYAFEIAAVVLLLAIVAAITLTMRKRPNLKVQDISAQVAVQAKDRVRIVKMDAEEKS